jgi:hypothetical protein
MSAMAIDQERWQKILDSDLKRGGYEIGAASVAAADAKFATG